jgi:integrase
MKASNKYLGIFLYVMTNGDISYYIGYNHPITKEYQRIKIGQKSQGISEQYCYNKRSEILNQLRLGENPLQKQQKQVTFDSLAELYLTYLEKASRSVSSYNSVKGRYTIHIKPYFGHKNAASITPEDINVLRELKFSEGKSEGTVKHVLDLISIIYNFAIKHELYEGKNPCKSAKIKKIKLNNARERFLDKGEVDMILSDARIINDPVLDLFVRIALSTGARYGTIMDIQKKDINITNRIVMLKNLKTNSIYHGYLNEQLLPDLTFFNDMKPNDYIVNLNGKKIKKFYIQYRLKVILNDLFNKDLDKKDAKNRVVVHTLRHSFASILAMNGIPIYQIQKLLDHKDSIMTQRYAKLSPESSFDAVNSMFA